MQHLANDDTAAIAEHPALTRAAAVAAHGHQSARLAAWPALGILLAAAVAFGAAAPAVLADDGSPPPTTSAPLTCADRFPGQGPAGVDLQLGCIVSVVVGAYTPGQSANPPPLSTYAIAVVALVAALALAAWAGGRLLARRAGRRLAPVLPGAWWVCPTCRSVNGAATMHCYGCGTGRPDGPMLTTDASPATPQSFGARRKSG